MEKIKIDILVDEAYPYFFYGPTDNGRYDDYIVEITKEQYDWLEEKTKAGNEAQRFLQELLDEVEDE